MSGASQGSIDLPVPDAVPSSAEKAGVDDDCRCELAKTRYQAELELGKARYQALLEIKKAESTHKEARQKAEWEALHAGFKKFHEDLAEVSKGAIDRSRSGAEGVRTAAAAVGTIYAAVLGVAFSADQPLPPRGLVPAVFLGLSILLATTYLVSLPKSVDDTSGVSWPLESGQLRSDYQAWTTAFINWVRATTLRGRSLLAGAVAALGLGIAFLPAAFISLDQGPSDATSPALPNPPTIEATATEGEVALLQIRYQAEVDEAVAAREASEGGSEQWANDRVRWFYFLAGMALVGVFVLVLGGSRRAEGRSTT